MGSGCGFGSIARFLAHQRAAERARGSRRLVRDRLGREQFGQLHGHSYDATVLRCDRGTMLRARTTLVWCDANTHFATTSVSQTLRYATTSTVALDSARPCVQQSRRSIRCSQPIPRSLHDGRLPSRSAPRSCAIARAARPSTPTTAKARQAASEGHGMGSIAVVCRIGSNEIGDCALTPRFRALNRNRLYI
jgi:hypothetical protein